MLTCLGWPARRLAGLVFAEVALVGLVAGALATGAALGLSRFAGVPMSVGHALLAVPAGLGVAALAAAPPALVAAFAHPAVALGPAVLGVRRARRRHTVLGLALTNLRRVPGRTVLSVAALAVGVAALTMLVVIAVVFRGGRRRAGPHDRAPAGCHPGPYQQPRRLTWAESPRWSHSDTRPCPQPAHSLHALSVVNGGGTAVTEMRSATGCPPSSNSP